MTSRVAFHTGRIEREGLDLPLGIILTKGDPVLGNRSSEFVGGPPGFCACVSLFGGGISGRLLPTDAKSKPQGADKSDWGRGYDDPSCQTSSSMADFGFCSRVWRTDLHPKTYRWVLQP